MVEGVDDSCDVIPREPNIVKTMGTLKDASKQKP